MGIEWRFVGRIMGSKAFLTVKVCRIPAELNRMRCMYILTGYASPTSLCADAGTSSCMRKARIMYQQ